MAGQNKPVEPVELVKLVKTSGDSDEKDRQVLILTSGFSAEAFEKSKDVAKYISEHITQAYDVYVFWYDKIVSARQVEICNKHADNPVMKAHKEQELASELADFVKDCCDKLGLKKPHVLAKSAGGSVAINLAQIMELQSLYLFAPASVLFRKKEILGTPRITIGWNTEDPRIPMHPNMARMNSILGLMVKDDNSIEKYAYVGKSHDYNLKFVLGMLMCQVDVSG